MPKKTQYFYYRIYDDEEKFNYFRSTCTEKRIRQMLKKYEEKRQEYHNAGFLEFLRKQDPRAEMIDVAIISY